MSFDQETLYNLLPAIYRIRDSEHGESLKALVQIIAREVNVLEEDLAQLYDDQFIETCAEWIIPYIGDLIGNRPIYTDLPKFPSARAEVANTIRYRRRKGTAAMLESLAKDVTDWPARGVEFFQKLATTQYINHIRFQPLATADLRSWQTSECLGTPFETTAYTAEVRRIKSQRGRYNIPNIGLFLWRLKPYTIGLSKTIDQTTTVSTVTAPGTARAVTSPPDGRYWFHPAGLNAPLFNNPLEQTELTHLAEPINVPEPLNRRVLYEELEACRQAIAEGQSPVKAYFREDDPVFEILIREPNGSITPISPEHVLICNLSDWRRPSTSTSAPQSRPIQAAVDPVLGRIIFPNGVIPNTVYVRYTYGFSHDIGGGPYDRQDSVLPILAEEITWQIGVTSDPTGNEQEVSSISAAITAWNNQPPGTTGIITILDSSTYTEPFPTIQIPEESFLLIVAADWSVEVGNGSSNPQQYVMGSITAEGRRPHLIGNLAVEGTSPTDSNRLGRMILNGLWLEGTLTVEPGNLEQLSIAHCTLIPDKGSLTVGGANSNLSLWIDHSISGPIAVEGTIRELHVQTSLIDAGASLAINASKVSTTITASTLIGETSVQILEASNSIFTQTVTAERHQEGCVRFSSLPLASKVPRRYRCQPQLALQELIKSSGKTERSPMEQEIVQRRVAPQFTSLVYGYPGYGQLSQRCADEIRHGADDASEMGVFHDLYQPQRETNLQLRLDEYLRFSLGAGIFFAT
ncbi:MAG: hypothetical protein AAGD25_31320 [Cyanobacteria bacterium P01_F01_bin.150]